MSGLSREVSIEFETPDVFHELPLHLPAEVLDAALWELAEKIWPAGTEFQRETTALVYADLTDTLVADGVMYASLGLFETEDGEVSTANLIARVESVDGEEPAVVAASVQEELALQEHRDVHQVDLPCGPAVLSFHSTEIDGDSALSSLAFAHVELYVPSSLPGGWPSSPSPRPALPNSPATSVGCGRSVNPSPSASPRSPRRSPAHPPTSARCSARRKQWTAPRRFGSHARTPSNSEPGECAFPLEYVVAPIRGEPFAYATVGTPPNWALPPGTEPRYTLYRTKDTSEPIVVLVAQGQQFTVLTPDHHVLAELRLPPPEQWWRPVREIVRPKQPLLRARGASISSIIKSVLYLPFIIIEFLLYLTDGDIVIDPPTPNRLEDHPRNVEAHGTQASDWRAHLPRLRQAPRPPHRLRPVRGGSLGHRTGATTGRTRCARPPTVVPFPPGDGVTRRSSVRCEREARRARLVGRQRGALGRAASREGHAGSTLRSWPRSHA